MLAGISLCVVIVGFAWYFSFAGVSGLGGICLATLCVFVCRGSLLLLLSWSRFVLVTESFDWWVGW